MAYKSHGMERTPNKGGYAFGLHTVVLRSVLSLLPFSLPGTDERCASYRPQSTGTIRLRSANPADPPVIDPRYLSDPEGNDIKVLIRGIRLLHKISRTPPLADMIDPAGAARADLQHGLGAPGQPDKEIEAFVRANVETLYHPACTARMAPLADGGVVDPRLRVHGVAGLRVADASVFPSIVAGHTTAPVYAIAEKAADLLKEDLGGRK